MRDFINPDNAVMQFITKLAYSVYLNILWFICCIPIVTIGASTTSLFYVTLKMAKNEEGNITRAFFHSFKENFKQSTKIWLLLFGLGIILGIDGYVLYHLRFENTFWTILTAFFLVALIGYCIILMYIFPLMARFDNTILAMLKNSLFVGIRFLFCTIIMTAIYFFMAVIIIRVFTPAVIFGEGLCAFLCSYLLANILILLEEKNEKEPADIAVSDIR